MYIRACVCRRESGDERERDATNENTAQRMREEDDNSMLLGRTKVATLRASCPSGEEKERKKDRALGEGLCARALSCESNFPATTNTPLERQHPTEVRREARKNRAARQWCHVKVAE